MSYKQKAVLKVLERIEKEFQVAKDPEAKERREKAFSDFFFFCNYYLSGDFTAPPAEYQKILVKIINQECVTKEDVETFKKFIHSKYHGYLKPIKRLKGIVDVEPRGHGKSTRMSLAYPLWRVLTGKSRFVVIVAASEREALRILKFIKWELVDNEKIIADFGSMRTDVWRADYVELANGTAIQALGSGSSMRGIRFKDPRTGQTFRPDLVICDDIMKDELAYSAVQREKLYDWFKRTVLPLGKDVFVVVINTIFHNDDLPSRLLREIEEEKLKGWLGLRFAAFLEDGETPLWKEYWSKETLFEKKEALGSVKFATEYMNEPLSEEDKLFRQEWLRFYNEAEYLKLLEAKHRFDVVMAVDPATGKQKGDYSAVVVCAKDKETGLIYIREAFGDRISDISLAEKIIQFYEKYKPRIIVFEEVAFQEIYKKEVMRIASKKGIHLPMRGVKPKAAKEVRIQKLSPLIESGLLLFKKDQRLLLDQLLDYPHAGHDDLPDALEMAVSALESEEKKPFAFSCTIRRKSREIVNKLRRFYG